MSERFYLKELRDWERRERDSRNLAWFPYPRTIGNVDVRVMTPDDLLLLTEIGSPYVCGGRITDEEIARFLWFMSDLYDAHRNDSLESQEEIKAGFMAAISAQDFDALAAQISEYLDLIWMDAPGGGGGPTGLPAITSIVDWCAGEYHWSEETIRAKPIPRIFQLMKASAIRQGYKSPSFSLFSDRLKSEFLAAINEIPVEERDAWHQRQKEAANG